MLPSLKKRSFRVLPIAAALTIVSGCAAPAPSDTVAAPAPSGIATSAASSPDQGSSAPTAGISQTATATPGDIYSNLHPDLTEIENSTVLNLVNENGYKANFTVTWHKVANLQEGDFFWFPNCVSFLPNFSPDAPQRTALRGAVVSVSAEFPSADGFVWPDAQPISVSAGGEEAVGARGTFECIGDDAMTFDGSYDLSPSGNTQVNFLVYEEENITPNNPTGAFPVNETPNYSLRIRGDWVDCGKALQYSNYCYVPNET